MPDDVAAFIDCIEHDKEPVMTPKFAAQFTEVILAGYKSAATGKEVSLPLPR
jgi:predicted dehydrogenase